jgi:hypothetical protein
MLKGRSTLVGASYQKTSGRAISCDVWRGQGQGAGAGGWMDGWGCVWVGGCVLCLQPHMAAHDTSCVLADTC